MMSEKQSVIIKNKKINANAVILSLITLLLSIVIPLLIGRISGLEEDEIVKYVPYGLCVGAVGIIFIF